MHRDTLRVWARRAQVDEGRRPRLTTDKQAWLKDLGRENKERRLANEMAGSGGGRNDLCATLTNSA